MLRKTHQTAVAVVPPQEVWGPVQAIRQRHDRQFRRWMPHINLLYPFAPPERFEEIVPRVVAACEQVAPFGLILAEFRFFRHSSGTATLWLAPEPREALIRLQAGLQAACPECDDLTRFAAGFTPHLSVGQAGSAKEAEQLREMFQRTWEPIQFGLSAVAVLQRDRDAPFKVSRWISLTGTA